MRPTREDWQEKKQELAREQQLIDEERGQRHPSPTPTVTEEKCSSCDAPLVAYLSGQPFCQKHFDEGCDEVTRSVETALESSETSPTVTVPREEWERMQAESEAWKAIADSYQPKVFPDGAWAAPAWDVFKVVEWHVARLCPSKVPSKFFLERLLAQPNAAEGK